jgi:hypothetical protein
VINMSLGTLQSRAIFSIPGFGIGVGGIPGSRNTIRVGKMGFEKPRIFRFFKKSKNVKVQNVRRFFRLFILSCTNCNFSVCDFMSLQQFYFFEVCSYDVIDL